MKKMKYFTAKVLAVILAGALTAGSLSVSAFGAEESPGIADTSEMEIEDLDSADPSDPADTVPSDSDTSGDDDADDAEMIYTVTLDANGGYFEDVWDDVLEEYVDRAEIIKKFRPGIVSRFFLYSVRTIRAPHFRGGAWSGTGIRSLRSTGNSSLKKTARCMPSGKPSQLGT